MLSDRDMRFGLMLLAWGRALKPKEGSTMTYRERVIAAKIAVEDALEELERMPRHFGGHKHGARNAKRTTNGPMRSGCRVLHRDGRQGLFLRFEGPTGAVVYFKRGEEARVVPARTLVRVA